MKKIALASVFALLNVSAHAEELPLKRVVLSTSGLAQFTHAGEGAGGSTIDLSVRLDQVDDLLKSLTIFDREGAVGAVSLQGKAPLAELFRDLPFRQEALNSPAELLNALVGSEVEIEGEINAKGRVFRVEKEVTQAPNNGGQTTRHRLTILTDKGFAQAILEDLSALRFTDPQTQAQIDRALAGIAQNRAKERRSLSIALAGQGRRPVGFSYVVAAPVWKTAYRLVLPKENGKARLQGWGVVENLTGSDWKDVDLTLISGNPVALKQSLYTAFYVDRPEIPVAASARVMPRKDEAGEERQAPMGGAKKMARSLAMAAASPPAPAAQARYSAGLAAVDSVEAYKPEADDIGKSALATQSEEAATQVLFRFPSAISLPAGSTMMAPFIDRDISATRTWLYQPETNATRPLAAVRLQNDSDSGLPAGIITAFDTGGDGTANFAGDAQLPFAPKGSSKFVTFALDSKTDIRRIDRAPKQTRLGKAVRGEFTLTTKSRWDIDYEITPPTDEDRDLVIEEARSDGWQLAKDTKNVEETAGRLRYKVMASKGQTTKATLTREHTDQQSITLSSLEPEGILATVGGLQNETPGLRDTIAKLSGIVADINKANARREALDAERRKIGEDQDRIRRNLTSVGQSSDLGRRYLDNLKSQEDRLAAIADEGKAIEGELAAKHKAAEDVAKALNL